MSVPLSLYIHVPWCVKKCPYCDFNSHQLPASLDQDLYIDALLKDLESDIPLVGSREIATIFIGGGTPSLFSPTSIERLLSGIRNRVRVCGDAEITLEANPGATDAGAFEGFLRAGVNRLSIGVQSFSRRALQALGRIHSVQEAVASYRSAIERGFDNINLDLMFGLPGQSLEEAEADIRRVIELSPAQVSYYQLTLEPNTAFFNNPPALPDDEFVWDCQRHGKELLESTDYLQYEISAFARPGCECRHNLNYWRFGDYIGIGAGAHGKLTDSEGKVRRRTRVRGPDRYLALACSGEQVAGERVLDESDLIFEFMLNALRLKHGFDAGLFERRTGLPFSRLSESMKEAENRGLLGIHERLIKPTALGWRFLNDLQETFLPD